MIAFERTLLTTSGTLNVRVEGSPTNLPPFLLVHAFAGSLRAWDLVAGQLSSQRQVVRVDLLGHGSSSKPRAGYSMPNQATVICSVLDQLDIERVVAVGHSGGGDAVVAMIEHHRRRVAAAVLLGTPPNLSFVDLPLTARLISTPLLGRLLWSGMSDRMIRDGLAKTFAPSFNASDDIYDLLISDFRRMTHHSYVRSRSAVERYRKARDLTDRVAGQDIPLLVMFGDEDQWVDPEAATPWSHLAETHTLAKVGHTPMIETPRETADAILDFTTGTKHIT